MLSQVITDIADPLLASSRQKSNPDGTSEGLDEAVVSVSDVHTAPSQAKRGILVEELFSRSIGCTRTWIRAHRSLWLQTSGSRATGDLQLYLH